MASASDGANKGGGTRGSKINKPEKVQLASDILFIHLTIVDFCTSKMQGSPFLMLYMAYLNENL